MANLTLFTYGHLDAKEMTDAERKHLDLMLEVIKASKRRTLTSSEVARATAAGQAWKRSVSLKCEGESS